MPLLKKIWYFITHIREFTLYSGDPGEEIDEMSERYRRTGGWGDEPPPMTEEGLRRFEAEHASFVQNDVIVIRARSALSAGVDRDVVVRVYGEDNVAEAEGRKKEKKKAPVPEQAREACIARARVSLRDGIRRSLLVEVYDEEIVAEAERREKEEK